MKRFFHGIRFCKNSTSCKNPFTPSSITTMVVLIFIFFSRIADAYTVTVTLDDIPNVSPGETFYDEGVAMNLFFSFDIDNDNMENDGVWIHPGILVANFSTLPNLLSSLINVQIDVADYSASAGMKAYLYNEGTLLDQTSSLNSVTPETLYLSGGPRADQIVITGFDSFINEMRITAVPLPSVFWLFGSGIFALIGAKKIKKIGSKKWK